MHRNQRHVTNRGALPRTLTVLAFAMAMTMGLSVSAQRLDPQPRLTPSTQSPYLPKIKPLRTYLDELKKPLAQDVIFTDGIVHDQTEFAENTDLNPPFEPLRREKNNKNHKVVVAVIDHGVDYFHPALADHLHYGEVAGGDSRLGYDFVGEDIWPYHSIGRLKKNHHAQPMLDHLRRHIPEIESALVPYRDHLKENEVGVAHGTVISGLVSFLVPEIGVIPYRVLPRTELGRKTDGRVSEASVPQRVLDAAELAIEDGARVLNFSLVIGATDMDDVWMEKFKALALKNPQAVFVAAAGNAAALLTGEREFIWPCEVDAPNVICVAATSFEDTILDVSNVPLVKKEVLYGAGDSMLSAWPRDLCASNELSRLLSHGQLGILKPYEVRPESIGLLRADCVSTHAYRMLRGTSLSTALASRFAALELIENPKLTGAQVYKRLKAQSTRRMLPHPRHPNHGEFEVFELDFISPGYPGYP